MATAGFAVEYFASKGMHFAICISMKESFQEKRLFLVKSTSPCLLNDMYNMCNVV